MKDLSYTLYSNNKHIGLILGMSHNIEDNSLCVYDENEKLVGVFSNATIEVLTENESYKINID